MLRLNEAAIKHRRSNKGSSQKYQLPRLQRLEIELKIITGYNMEQLKTLFLQGFALEKLEPVDIEKALKYLEQIGGDTK